MKEPLNSYDFHPFLGGNSPLATLMGGSLLILASSRFSFALVCAGSLLWVYCLTALAVFAFRPILPIKGRPGLFVFLSAIIGSFYLLILSFLSPLLVLNTFFFLILSPVCCISSGLLEWIGLGEPADGAAPQNSEFPEIEAVLIRSFSESAALGILILALSLIREPIGFAVLSFPGGAQGIVTLFSAEEGGFFPVFIAASSAGALMFLGYGIALFRRFRGQYFRQEEH
ncbi:hypothetical protein AGMMS49587_13700 [Spirochaetia bacterium]|nr:hypothetical protein AGMMS49587_13700 [Spirochaetia bacterium]